MFCYKCGSQLPDTTKFCTRCGTQLKAPSAPPVPIQQMPVQQYIPPIQQPAPVMEAPVPVMEAPAPVMEAPIPVMEAPIPVMEAPVPVMEAPVPVMEAPVPVMEAPIPVMEAPIPVVEAPIPVMEAPIPVMEAPIPVMEAPAPVMEAPAPVMEAPIPVTEMPVVEEESAPVERAIDPIDEILASVEKRAVSDDEETAADEPDETTEQPVVKAASAGGAATGKRNILILAAAAVVLAAGAFAAITFMGGDKAEGVSDPLLIAESYLSEKKYEQAEAEYKKVLNTDPDNVDAMLGMYQALDAQGDTAQAEDLRSSISEIFGIEDTEPEKPQQTTASTQTTTTDKPVETTPAEEEKPDINSHTEELTKDEHRELMECFALFDFSPPLSYSEYVAYVAFDDIKDVELYYLIKAVYPYLAEGADSIREGEHGTEYVIPRKSLIKLINKYICDGFNISEQKASESSRSYDRVTDTYTIGGEIHSTVDRHVFTSVVIDAYKKGDDYYVLACNVSDSLTETYILDNDAPISGAWYYGNPELYRFTRGDNGRFKIKSKSYPGDGVDYPAYLEILSALGDLKENGEAVLCDIDGDGCFDLLTSQDGKTTIRYSSTLKGCSYEKLLRNEASDITLMVNKEEYTDENNGVLSSGSIIYTDLDHNVVFRFTVENIYKDIDKKNEMVTGYYVNHIPVTAEEYVTAMNEVEKYFTEYTPEAICEFDGRTAVKDAASELMELCPFKRP